MAKDRFVSLRRHSNYPLLNCNPVFIETTLYRTRQATMSLLWAEGYLFTSEQLKVVHFIQRRFGACLVIDYGVVSKHPMYFSHTMPNLRRYVTVGRILVIWADGPFRTVLICLI